MTTLLGTLSPKVCRRYIIISTTSISSGLEKSRQGRMSLRLHNLSRPRNRPRFTENTVKIRLLAVAIVSSSLALASPRNPQVYKAWGLFYAQISMIFGCPQKALLWETIFCCEKIVHEIVHENII